MICLLWMHAIPDASVDLVLCDLYYSIARDRILSAALKKLAKECNAEEQSA